jgi:hypothetical protein
MKAKSKLTPLGKISIIVIIFAVIVGVKFLIWDKLPQNAKESTDIGKVSLPDAPEASFKGEAVLLALPEQAQSSNGGSQINWKIMAWNAQFGLMYANGGAKTTKNSLIEKAGLQVNLFRQDDCNKNISRFGKICQRL